MIDYETFCRVRHLREKEGLTIVQIAQEVGRNTKTISRWLAKEHYQPKMQSEKTSKLEPYKGQVIDMLHQHHYSITQVFQRLFQQGYKGGRTILREFIRQIRPKRKPAFLTLYFEPGECAQVDWGCYGNIAVGSIRRRLSFFVMVLCYSRMIYVDFTVSEKMEHFLECHQKALEFFGGVPQKIMIDNLKTGVLLHPEGQKAIFNPRYLDFAAHYGFHAVACNVRKANEKGRVESAVGYVKKNFLNGLVLSDFRFVGPAAKEWRDTIANVRIHGETHKKPVDLFEEEKRKLTPLAAHRYDVGITKTVRASRCFRVTLETNRYSVPDKYASQLLQLRSYPDRICIYDGCNLIAIHPRSYDRHQDFENPDHVRELLNQRRNAREQKLLQRFLSSHSKAGEYYQKLQNKRVNARLHVQKIVALMEIYGEEEVAKAMEDSFECDAISSEYIANILEQRKNQPHSCGAIHLTHKAELLSLETPAPDLSIYTNPSPTNLSYEKDINK